MLDVLAEVHAVKHLFPLEHKVQCVLWRMALGEHCNATGSVWMSNTGTWYIDLSRWKVPTDFSGGKTLYTKRLRREVPCQNITLSPIKMKFLQRLSPSVSVESFGENDEAYTWKTLWLTKSLGESLLFSQS